MNNSTSTQSNAQYSLAKILGLWVAAAAPMGILAFVVYPALVPDFEADIIGAGFARVGLITVGLIWQFVLSMIIVFREEGDLRWATIRRRFWLNTPLDPKTGESRRKLWLWLIPLILLYSLTMMTPILEPLNRLWVSVFPFFAMPASANLDTVLRAPEIAAQLVGNWSFFGLFLVLAVFNILGEEFIFRGVLLPKMEGVFGKWDWVANGVLGTLYHTHMPWSWLGTTGFSWIFLYALPAKYFRSTWVSVVAHGSMVVLETIIFLVFILGLA